MAESYGVTTGAQALVASETKTKIGIITSSSQTARLIQADIGFDASTVAAGIAIEIVRFTTDGTGSAYTPTKYNGEAQNRAALCTAKTLYTAEPTGGTVIESHYVPSTAELFWQLPLSRELYIPPSTILGLRTVMPGTVSGNYRLNAVFEE